MSVAVEQVATVGEEGLAILLQHRAEARLGLLELLAREDLLERHEHRRIGSDPQLPVDPFGQLRHRPHPVLALGLGDVALEPAPLLLADLRRKRFADLIDVDPPVPDVEIAEAGEAAHVLAIGPRRGEHDLASLLAREPSVPAPDLETRGQPFDVPLPRSGEGFVEVVDVDDQAAVRRRVGAEVREVSVPARLHPEPGAGRLSEVGRHDRGGAAIEGEGGDEHPAVAQGDEIGDPIRRLALEHVDRVGPVGRRLPFAVAGARRALARRLARRRSFGRGLLDLEDVHQISLVVVRCDASLPLAMRASRRRPSRKPSGSWADGEAPG